MRRRKAVNGETTQNKKRSKANSIATEFFALPKVIQSMVLDFVFVPQTHDIFKLKKRMIDELEVFKTRASPTSFFPLIFERSMEIQQCELERQYVWKVIAFFSRTRSRRYIYLHMEFNSYSHRFLVIWLTKLATEVHTQLCTWIDHLSSVISQLCNKIIINEDCPIDFKERLDLWKSG